MTALARRMNDLEQRLGVPASRLVQELEVPLRMRACRAFVYPVPPPHLAARFRCLRTFLTVLALRSARGDVTVYALRAPTGLLGAAHATKWRPWARHLRPQGTPKSCAGAAVGIEIDVGWFRAITNGSRDDWLSSPWSSLDAPLIVEAAEDALMSELDGESASMTLETHRSLPKWIADRYLVARYLAAPDPQIAARRWQAWIECKGPTLDALRHPTRYAGLLQTIDNARPLTEALCARLGVERWAYRCLAALPTGELIRMRDTHGEQRQTPVEMAAATLRSLGRAAAPRSSGEARFLLCASYAFQRLAPMVILNLLRDLRRRMAPLDQEIRRRAWLRLTGAPRDFLDRFAFRLRRIDAEGGLRSRIETAGLTQLLELTRVGLPPLPQRSFKQATRSSAPCGAQPGNR